MTPDEIERLLERRAPLAPDAQARKRALAAARAAWSPPSARAASWPWRWAAAAAALIALDLAVAALASTASRAYIAPLPPALVALATPPTAATPTLLAYRSAQRSLEDQP